MPGPPLTPEQRAKGTAAARAAKKSRAEKRKADPLYDARMAVAELVRDLLHAARGEGKWASLSAKEQLSALFKALEYGTGKPVTVDKTTAPSEPPVAEPPGGITIQ